MTPALSFSNVYKKYGNQIALDDINLKISKGEKVAILGCNGAGKSSLINIVCGLRKKSSGEVKVLGENPGTNILKIKLGILPQSLKFPSALKVNEIIQIIEKHFSKEIDNKIKEILLLEKLENRFCHQLSGGEERKLALALSLIGNKELLILDEPTANVDVLATEQAHSLLREYLNQTGSTLIFSSHEMKEVEALADRVIVLHQGKIVTEGSVGEIKRQFGPVKLIFNSDEKQIALSSAIKFERINEQFTFYGESGDEMVSELVRTNVPFKHLKVEESGLEEVFIKLWSER